jgi:hypothetical protein
MFTKEQLIQKINNTKAQTSETLEFFLKSWRIDPIYEDEENNEYYDEMAVSKIKHAFRLKDQGKNNEEITSIINSGIITPAPPPVPGRNFIRENPGMDRTGLNKVTIDVTSQTLSLLAESIAQKITVEITDKIKNSNVFEPVIDSAKMKRDNEILSKQVETLLEEIKNLKIRNNTLKKENAKFKPLFGNWYIKQGE